MVSRVTKNKGGMIERTYQYRLYPSKQQQALIEKTFSACGYIYDDYLEYWRSNMKGRERFFSKSELSKDLGLTKAHPENAWLKEVDATALIDSLDRLSFRIKKWEAEQKSWMKKRSWLYDLKSKKPEAPLKKEDNPVTSYTSKGGIEIKDGKLKFKKLGLIKFKYSREIEGRIISGTIKRNPSGKYIANLVVKEAKPSAYDKTGSEVGIDLGIPSLMVLSNKDRVKNIRALEGLEKRLIAAHRSLFRKKGGSQNYGKARLKLARIHAKIANIRRDHLHKETTKLVKNHDLICVEDLSVVDMVKNKNISKALMDASFGYVVSWLTYKSEWYGKTLIKVGRYFPSSQLCSNCGYKESKVKDLNLSKWECPVCHAEHDRDYNASLNILKEGQRLNSLTKKGT